MGQGWGVGGGAELGVLGERTGAQLQRSKPQRPPPVPVTGREGTVSRIQASLKSTERGVKRKAARRRKV